MMDGLWSGSSASSESYDFGHHFQFQFEVFLNDIERIEKQLDQVETFLIALKAKNLASYILLPCMPIQFLYVLSATFKGYINRSPVDPDPIISSETNNPDEVMEDLVNEALSKRQAFFDIQDAIQKLSDRIRSLSADRNAYVTTPDHEVAGFFAREWGKLARRRNAVSAITGFPFPFPGNPTD